MNDIFIVLIKEDAIDSSFTETSFLGARNNFEDASRLMKPNSDTQGYTVVMLDSNLNWIETWNYEVEFKRETNGYIINRVQ
jgi:hypothetical protein